MVPFDLEALRSRTAALKLRLSGLLRAREEALLNFNRRKRLGDIATQEAKAKEKQERDAELHRIRTRLAATQDLAGARHARYVPRIERAFSSACTRIREKLRLSVDKLADDERRTRDDALNKLHEKHGILEEKLAGHQADAEDLLAEAGEVKAAAARLFSYVGGAPDGDPPPPPADLPSPDEVAPRVRDSLRNLRKDLGARWRDAQFRLVRFTPIPIVAILLFVACAAAAVTISSKAHPPFPTLAAGAGAAWVALLVLFILARGGVKRSVRSQLASVAARIDETIALLQAHKASLKRAMATQRERLVDEKIHDVAEIRDRFRDQGEELNRWERKRLDELARRRTLLLESAHRSRERKTSEASARASTEEMTFQERLRADLERRQGDPGGQGEDIAGEERRELERLGAEWKELLEEFRRTSAEARATALERHPSWDDRSWEQPKMPSAFPEAVYIGDARVETKALAGGAEGDELFPVPADGGVKLPLALSFPVRGSLLVTASPAGRARGLEALQSTILRILGSFPPSKAKFTIIDPVGLGQNFSALMHLADFDESLVGGRIWTETTHIERKLSELTEHVEKVIQKYLRNRYASIAEYNPEVGAMAEPYQFLVVADFPAGFTDLAFDRLASIVTSGARCGVYTLLLHDPKQKPPASFPAARLQQGSLVCRADAGGLTLIDEVIPGGAVTIDAPPAGERLTTLLNTIGRLCADAKRVEVPYDIVSPKEDQVWTASSEKGIRVPLGRAGADRLQYLDLGKGTAQHALVAGRTGSGKSTLFHVMITNLAAWYAPRELEFYLIDYKKGVEFKTYATHAFPHGRVVAIESDREFGLSVLQRLQLEFARRAELYRKAGVQDFAGYRREGTGPYLPRILLMIDEFQEFFVEEDAIAQEAALLLDRIVRQGRAFGVHVILGSQTLGGSYSLAKATLGQMGVRIALQCSEADSYLILSDDNAAARLLSRPGEAIYNDMSGMVEGNNPFQIVWISDDIQERILTRIRDRAKAEGWQPEEAMTVFEGNVPADIRNNFPLRNRIEAPSAPGDGAGTVAWVGEANAIKGPTEVRFRNQGGANLLIVGQQKEAALGIVMGSVVGLAAAHPPRSARFLILDGSPPELGFGARFTELARAIPQDIELVEYGNVPKAIEDLDAEIKARQESGKTGPPTYLVIYDLQRFRKLRQGDEYEFSSGGEDKPPPSKCLANVLAEGPARGIHGLVWCDGVNNLTRTFSRKTMKEFEMRILFQMSPTDSAELIDSPQASKLGLHRGLLYLEQEGTLETFRPYGLPESAWLEEVKLALAGRKLGKARE